jgi:hypothetical protein
MSSRGSREATLRSALYRVEYVIKGRAPDEAPALLQAQGLRPFTEKRSSP